MQKNRELKRGFRDNKVSIEFEETQKRSIRLTLELAYQNPDLVPRRSRNNSSTGTHYYHYLLSPVSIRRYVCFILCPSPCSHWNKLFCSVWILQSHKILPIMIHKKSVSRRSDWRRWPVSYLISRLIYDATCKTNCLQTLPAAPQANTYRLWPFNICRFFSG